MVTPEEEIAARGKEAAPPGLGLGSQDMVGETALTLPLGVPATLRTAQQATHPTTLQIAYPTVFQQGKRKNKESPPD